MPAVPVLTVDQARALEQKLFGGNEAAEWSAMTKAGVSLTRRLLLDWKELGDFPRDARVLVLAGKGHNGGDALIAASELLRRFERATAELVLTFPLSSGRPLMQKAYRQIHDEFGSRIGLLRPSDLAGRRYTVSLDGVFGFQFQPPLRRETRDLFSAVAACDIRMRAAVDLPSGLGEDGALAADFTYATGIVKAPVLEAGHLEKTGRVRYLDLGFFHDAVGSEKRAVLTSDVLRPFRGWRGPSTDKRSFGQLLVLGGSHRYPGAVLMSVKAALKAGVGLLTACVPESLVGSYAAAVPEAMWVGCPVTPEGGIALESHHLIKQVASRCSTLLVGPGLGREAETLALLKDVVKEWTGTLVLDADALQGDVIAVANRGRMVLTPHAGEFARIASQAPLLEYAEKVGAIVVLKAPLTRVADSQTEYFSLAGGPVLARGGSGDMLAGMIAGLAAQDGVDPRTAACAGVVWHGMAADELARARGQQAVRATELLEFLPAALRAEEAV